MAKHQWSVLCRRGTVDSEDNSLSLIEVLEGIILKGDVQEQNKSDIEASSPEKKLLLPIPNQLVSLWVRTDFDKPEIDTVRIQVKTPDGKIVLSQEFNVNLTESARHRHRLTFPGVLFDGPGIYRYLTQQKKGSKGNAKWVTVSELLFDVTGPN